MTPEAEALVATARRLLEDGTVRSIIAYGRGRSGPKARPVFVSEPSAAVGLVWDPTCVHNLARYVVDDKRARARQPSADDRPVGVVVKGCDSRSVVVLLQERLIAREDVYLIGVSCGSGGVVDQRRLASCLSGQPVLGLAFGAGDTLLVETAAGQVSVPFAEVLADRCRECTAPSPALFDELIGEPVSRDVAGPFASLEAIGRLSQEERWAFWEKHFERCIRCYACRSVCPMCYCEECVADTTSFAVTAETTADEKARKVKWVERSAVISESAFFHLVRAIHLAGRCTDCGECERSCPVNIPLRLLNKQMEKEAKLLFGYEVGVDPEAPALVSSFRDDDPGEFIR